MNCTEYITCLVTTNHNQQRKTIMVFTCFNSEYSDRNAASQIFDGSKLGGHFSISGNLGIYAVCSLLCLVELSLATLTLGI